MSFQISITPSRKAAARFIRQVRNSLAVALSREHAKTGLTQAEVARRIGVHRSVVNRELMGLADITLGRVAELAYAMGKVPKLIIEEPEAVRGANHFSEPNHSTDSTATVVVMSAQPMAFATVASSR